MLNFVVRLGRAAVLVRLGYSLAFGRAQTGSLSGTVTDAINAAVPGATVDATLTATGTTLHTVSSESGLYVFPNLPTGIWTISVEKEGFKKLVRTDIQIFIAQRQALALKLQVGDVKQSVEVSVTQTLLETETSERGQSLTRKNDQTVPLCPGCVQNPFAFPNHITGSHTHTSDTFTPPPL